jgi:putative endonuclease
MVECADESLYTGITTDLDRRIQEHNEEEPKMGARYTRSKKPVRLVYHEQFDSRSSASKREMEIKSLRRSNKLKLLASAG